MKKYFNFLLLIPIIIFIFYISTVKSDSEINLSELKIIQKTAIQSNISETDKQVREQAKSELNLFLKQIPAGKESNYGFENIAEIHKSEVGIPYRVFTILPLNLINPAGKISDNFTSLDEWIVPITVDGNFKAFLTVVKKDNKFETVNFGDAGLAKEIQKYEEVFNNKKGKIILRQYQLECDFLIFAESIENAGNTEVYPLESARIVFGKIKFNNVSKNLSEIFKLIRDKYFEKYSN